MTAEPVYLSYRCGQCGGDGWMLSSHRGPVLCKACGSPMRCEREREEVTGPAVWVESQNFPRGWLGGGG